MKCVYTCAFVIGSFAVEAQTSEENTFDTVSENLLSGIGDEESENGEAAENFTQWLSHPLDLNRAEREQLRLLPGITDTQIENLLAHRTKYGKLVSLYELQTISGFDPETIQNLRKWVVVIDPALQINRGMISRVAEDGEHYVMVRYDHPFQKRKGFFSDSEDLKFEGHQGRIMTRIRSYRPGDFSLGITAEKDSGEKLAWDPGKKRFGMDHYAWHLQLQNKGRLKNLIAGDYQAQFGQGLVWGGGPAFGKGAETIANARKPGVGFIPYTSAYEVGNLRGIAATATLSSQITMNTAFSLAKRDASVQSDSAESIGSFQTTGLHRNARELSKRRTINEMVAGGVLSYQRNNLTAGITYQRVAFNIPVEPSALLYNHFAFRGRHNTNAGIFVNYLWNNLSFFSETAFTVRQGFGHISGVVASLTSKLDLSFLYRQYQKNYHPFYARGFSENTTTRNETGLYWGVRYKHSRKLQYVGYADLFRFPGLKFRTYAPTSGYEWLMRIQWQPSRSTVAFIQMREESKARNITPQEGTMYRLEQVTKRNYWISFDYQPMQGIRMKTRFQLATFRKDAHRSSGHTLLQDIAWATGKFKFTARYALFDTDDFATRQYVYEHDVWLSYALPAYQGKGIRQYVLMQYNLSKRYTFWIRYSHTRYTDREVIGSGVDEIEGNQQNDAKFEVRIRL